MRDVLVTLLAEVALNYLDVRTTQDRLHVAEVNLESQNETCQLAQWRYQAGLSDELAVQRARNNLENTRSQVPVLRTGLEEAMNRVAVLLGEQPGILFSGGSGRWRVGKADGDDRNKLITHDVEKFVVFG